MPVHLWLREGVGGGGGGGCGFITTEAFDSDSSCKPACAGTLAEEF